MRDAIYAIADSLSMSLYWDKKTSRLRGEHSREVSIAGVPFKVRLECVGSAILDGVIAAMFTGPGDLCLFIVSRETPRHGSTDMVDLHVIDSAKLDMESMQKFFSKIVEAKTVAPSLQPAIVATYHKDRKNRWSAH